MSKPVKLILWSLGVLVGAPLLFLLGFIIYITYTEFSPPVHARVEIGGTGVAPDPSQREFTFFSWNTGYAGLGREMDFFFDGGKRSRPPREKCLQYFDGIKKVIRSNQNADFIFLQEVDIYSKRAWYQDEYTALNSILPGKYHAFVPNYDCKYVPLPLEDPMGRVVGGLVTFSSWLPDDARVQYYNSDFPWPTRLAMLKRCYLLFRYRVDNGKELVIINLHNSAYDSTGALRERELFVLDSLLTMEYSRGNYIIAGGDWNSNPRGFDVKTIRQGDVVTPIEPPIQEKFFRGWQFAFDSLNPSNRFTDIAYQKGVTRTTLIDFFVVSPNVEITSVRTETMEFAFSDHEPVVMEIRLK